MRVVSALQVRQKLGELLDAAAAGERIVIERDHKPIAVLGPVFSGSVSATLKLTAEAEVPQIMGGEAGPLTTQGSKYLFRTSFGQQSSMPKIANYLRDGVKAKSVAVVFVNNDFGKGGRDAIVKELNARNIGLDWHGHNDRGLALSNALVAVQGAIQLATSLSGTPMAIEALADATELIRQATKLVYRIKITLPNPKGELKPGMPADAVIHAS